MTESLNQPNRVHKYLTKDLTVRASAVVATDVVEEMRSIQNSFPVPTIAVGRTMIASLLMASHLKNGQELSIYIQGSGALSSVFAQATFEGHVRGVSSQPQLIVPAELAVAGDKIKIAKSIGIGLMTVTHHLPMTGTPHRGTVELATSEIGDDVAYYLQQSHQIPSVVALGVHLDSEGKCTAAGGVLIELMPGHTEETALKIEARVKQAKSISNRILEGADATELLRDFLKDFELVEMEHEHAVEYKCRCSRERVMRSVGLLGLKELDEIIEKGENTDVSCEFCGRKYSLTPDDIREVRQDVYRDSLN
jgi:molecular chaperone Hsp33